MKRNNYGSNLTSPWRLSLYNAVTSHLKEKDLLPLLILPSYHSTTERNPRKFSRRLEVLRYLKVKWNSKNYFSSTLMLHRTVWKERGSRISFKNNWVQCWGILHSWINCSSKDRLFKTILAGVFFKVLRSFWLFKLEHIWD